MTTLTVRPEADATLVVNLPAHNVNHPAAVVYSETFESGLGGWTAIAGSAGNGVGSSHTGSFHLTLENNVAPYAATAARTITGLDIGRSYTFTAWAKRAPWPTSGTIGVTGKGTSAALALTTQWTKLSYTFTATATSHQLTISRSSPGNGYQTVYWDDIALTRNAWTEYVPEQPGYTATLPINQGKVRLDENYSPYVTASFQVPLDSLELLEQIDPRNPQRVTVTASSTGHHERVYTPWVEQRRNLYPNPRAVTGTGWSTAVGGGAASFVAGTVPAPWFEGGPTTVRRSTVTTAGTYMDARWAVSAVSAGGVYSMSGWQSFSRGGSVNLYALWRDASSATIKTDGFANVYTAVAGEPFQAKLEGLTAPAGATRVDFFVRLNAPISVGDTLEMTAALLVQGATVPEYFDGSTAIGDFQQTRWLGTADASASILETRAVDHVIWVREDVRTYDLGLRSRTVDHKAGTIDIEAASDEILLHDLKRVATTVDATPRANETSLRAVCNWALSKIGASLAPGTEDADLTAAWDATNLMTNPTAGTDLSGWSNTQGTISRLSTGAFPPNTSLASAVRATMNAGADRGPYFNGGDDSTILGGSLNVAIREKQLYRVSMYIRTSVAKTARLIVTQRNAANATAGRNLHGPNFTTVANTWTRVSYVFQAYPGAVRMGVFPFLPSSTYAAGNTVDVTGVMVTEGTRELDYFDGGTAVRPDLYAYSWNDTAHLSVSERRAHEVRRPELFDWTPGQPLFDFLQPLLNYAGLRLFCDENRVWRLVDPETYEVPGFVAAQTGHNATEGTDSITRNDDTWADAVVVKYTWTDVDGRTQTKYDAAGDPNGKTIFRELEREYPGPGAAASLLASFEGRGRTQSVLVIGKYLVTPGMDVSVNLPGTLTQVGKIRAAEFDLASGLTRIETRGLTEA